MRKTFFAVTIFMLIFLSSCLPPPPAPYPILPYGIWKSTEPYFVFYHRPELPSRPPISLGLTTINNTEVKLHVTQYWEILSFRDISAVTIRYDGTRVIPSESLFSAIWQEIDDQLHFIFRPTGQELLGYDYIVLDRYEGENPINPEDWFPS